MPGNDADVAHRVGIARSAILLIGKTRTEFQNGTMMPSAIVTLLPAPIRIVADGTP